MQVSISKAADMVGITRATLYRHIEKKGISIEKDEEGNPKIDVSELIRVYGDKVKTPEQDNEIDTANTANSIQTKQSNTPAISRNTDTELEVLREKVKHLEEGKDKSEEERKRERSQLTEQIESLRENLKESEEQQKRLTLLLTDQSNSKTEDADGAGEWRKSISALEDRIANQEKTSTEVKEKAEALDKENEELKAQLEEKEEKLKEEQKALELERSKSFLHKLFGS